jgi:hypothetical protein
MIAGEILHGQIGSLAADGIEEHRSAEGSVRPSVLVVDDGRIKWPYKTRAPTSQLFAPLKLRFHFGFEPRRLRSRMSRAQRDLRQFRDRFSV